MLNKYPLKIILKNLLSKKICLLTINLALFLWKAIKGCIIKSKD